MKIFRRFSDELLKGFSLSIIFRLSYIFGNYLFFFFTTNIYGVKSLGYFTLIETFIMLTSVLSRFGLDTASLRLISKYNSSKSYVLLIKSYKISFYLVTIISIIISLACFSLAAEISNIINKPEIKNLIKFSALFITPFSLLFLNSESFRGLKNILYYSAFNYLNTYLISTIIILLLYNFHIKVTINQPIFIFLFSSLSLFLISMVFWRLQLKKIVPFNYKTTTNDDISIKKILKISYPMLITSSMGYLLKWIGILVLSIYFTADKIGLYSLAVKISMLTSIALYSINSIAAPKFSELYTQRKIKELKSIIHKSSRLIFYLTIPILVTVLFFSSYILQTFGIELTHIKETKYALFILLIGQFSNAISGSTGFILQMTDKENTYKNIMFSFVLVNIILNFILVPNYGMLGAAISSSVCVVSWNLICVIFIYKHVGIISLYPLLAFNK